MTNHELIKDILKLSPQKAEDLASAKRKLAKDFKIGLPLNSQLITSYNLLISQRKIKRNEILEKLLRRRKIRTLSGVAPIAVLTKPYPCPGQCLYCPTERKMPKSYLANEPAVMRAIASGFNPYEQVKIRIKALTANGHPTDKIELIVMGGTWSYLPKIYQLWFIKECFRACNDKNDNPLVILRSPAKAGRREDPAQYKTGLPRRSASTSSGELLAMTSLLEKEQKKNETAKHRIVGLTLETRPDYITEKEIKLMRQLGATKIELGVQTLSDGILKLNQRGHSVNETIGATKLLKQVGFKICYHLMLNLYGSTPQRDLACFKELFSDSRFQPDLIKIYPTVVTKNSGLYRLWREKKYRPYSKKQLTDLIIKIKKIIPPYVRIIRIIRDIPSQSIIAGSKITNLRQLLQDKGVVCRCIRCREAKDKKFSIFNSQFSILKYRASDGMEYFLSYESKDEKILYAFCRLRLQKDYILPGLKNVALIRELHTYGQMVPLETREKTAIQHLGLGKKLMIEAEKIARQNSFEKIAVIAGVGVREYYRRLGYRLAGTYMVKKIPSL